MKKLVLVLVLALASLAGAWTLSYSEGVVTATAESTDVLGDLYLGLGVDADGVLSDYALGANAPSDCTDYGSYADNSIVIDDLTGEIFFMADYSTPYTYTTGAWLQGNFAFAEGSSSAVVYLHQFYDEGDPDLRAQITIPEPATIALLCLGGLLLRKK